MALTTLIGAYPPRANMEAAMVSFGERAAVSVGRIVGFHDTLGECVQSRNPRIPQQYASSVQWSHMSRLLQSSQKV